MNKLICVDGKQVRVRGRFLRMAQLEGDKYHFLENAESFMEKLKSCGTRMDLFTFIQKLPDNTKKYPFPMELDNFAALQITTFDSWWTNTLGFKGRNKAKQAQKKGVVVQEVPFDRALAKGISDIYNETPIRQGKRFPHYGKNLDTIYNEEATFLDTSTFIGAFSEGVLIGFIKLTWDETRTQAGLMNIVSLIGHRDKAPTNALVAQAVRSCADRGISYLTYSNFAYGNKQTSSLSDFKERNGFQRMEVPRYYVPLTALGTVALRLGLQHKLASRLPEPLGAKLRELRDGWYARKFPSVKEAL